MDVFELGRNGSVRAAAAPGKKTVAALGAFDGVHIGHRALLAEAVRLAGAEGPDTRSAAVTFFEPPCKPGVGPARMLTTPGEKQALFAEAGIELAAFLHFPDVRHLTPEAFVRDVLVGELHCSTAVCGFNFRFGAAASGDAQKLRDLMRAYGGDAVVLPPVTENGYLVSASLVRRLVESGMMETAQVLLGRPFAIRFPVVHGKEIGRAIGVPTINQDFPSSSVIPARGVYAVRVQTGGTAYAGVANVGIRPTFLADGGTPRVNCETHILDYSGELYGTEVQVDFVKYLRPEIRFGNAEALRSQIESDILRAKTILDPDGIRENRS